MPWSKDNLPVAVKNKKWSSHQIKVFCKAANSALQEYKDDGKAIAVGIHAANNLDNSIVETEAVFKKVPFIEPGLVNYKDLGMGTFFVKKETLDNMIKSLRGKPVIINHNPDIESDDVQGYVTNVLYNSEDGQYYAEFMLHTQEGKQAAHDLKFGSCAYSPEYAGKGGLHNAIPYDDEIIGGEFTHLALVDKPRYENARILNNSLKEKQMDDKTIMEKITELFNSKFPSKTEAKDEHVIKIGDEELTIGSAKELINSMKEKEAKKAKKKAKKEKKALKNEKGDAKEPKESKEPKKEKAHENSLTLENLLENSIDKKQEEELFNALNTAKDKVQEDTYIDENQYITEKSGYALAKKMGI